MHYTIEKLIEGRQDVFAYYQKAVEQWKEILSSPDAKTVEQLALRLSSDQMWFEHNCGGRWVGQEIMAIVGIAQFYTTDRGFDNIPEAVKVFNAFKTSYCSMEVKSHAEETAENYHLLEYANE